MITLARSWRPLQCEVEIVHNIQTPISQSVIRTDIMSPLAQQRTDPGAMSQDEEHLRLLSIFHYVVGGLGALVSFFALIYTAAGWFMLYAAAHPQKIHGEPPSAFAGWLFIILGAVFFLGGETVATCIILSGRFLARRRRYWFVFVLACMECLFFPFGTILGVFTIVVLARRSVKELFGVELAGQHST